MIMTEGWLARAVDEFWARADEVEPFPRTLEAAISQALPLIIVKLPRLTIHAADKWLRARSRASPFNESNRRLRGCLIAHAGQGIIMLDGADSEAERRYTVAHELAHFILDYLEPRHRAVALLGPSIVEVLDGIRPAWQDERIDAVIGQVSIGIHSHLMERAAAREIRNGQVLAAEERADRLALELLAPADEARSRLTQGSFPKTRDGTIQRVAQLLVGEFGLPLDIAQGYAQQIIDEIHPGPTLVEWLGENTV